MPFIWHALPPETNVLQLMGGPGVSTITAAAESYLVSAESLMTAAADTESAMLDMGGTWNGMSADKAQEAFRNHINWLHEQSVVAQEVSGVLSLVAAQFAGAKSLMAGVGAVLAENLFERAVLIATSPISNNGELLVKNLLEYFTVIWPAAAGVMDVYEAAVVPTLAALPPPAVPVPIVSGDPGLSPPPPQFDVPAPNIHPKVGPDQRLADPINNTNTDTNTNTSNNTGDSKPGNTDPGNTDPGSTDPTNTPTDPAQSGTADPSDATSPMNNSGLNPGMDGIGDSSVDQPGFLGSSPNSPTLSGLSGGAGSLVSLGMVRGGLGAMPGASTGFRMPSNWLHGPGTAFGPSSNPAATGPAARSGPGRGAIAPKARMRRRRDEERKPGKVFVPGEELDVPVLEKTPVIGVIEYADNDRPDDAAPQESLSIGILDRADDDEAIAQPEPAR